MNAQVPAAWRRRRVSTRPSMRRFGVSRPTARSTDRIFARNMRRNFSGRLQLADFFILLPVALGTWVNPWWYAFTAFVGFNLIQSSFTNFCPLEKILARVGFPGCKVAAR